VLEPAHADYVQFHVEMVGCPVCEASLSDLQEHQAATGSSETVSRRQKYFQSSAGYLKKL